MTKTDPTEERIGRALSRAGGPDGAGDCPGLETLAALGDGTLAAAERDAVLGHLAACADCRQVYELARQLQQEPAGARSRRWLWAPAVAAAALVLLVVRFTDLSAPPPAAPPAAETSVPRVARQPLPPAPAPATPGSVSSAPAVVATLPADFVARLAVRLEPLPPLAVSGRSPAARFAFAPAAEPAATGFRTGTALLRLAAAGQRNDRAGVATALGELEAVLASGGPDWAAGRRAAADLARSCGEVAPRCVGGSTTVLAALPPQGRALAQLGAWVEQSRLLLAAAAPEGVDRESLTVLRRLLPPAEAETRSDLAELARLLAAPRPGRRDLGRIADLLDRLQSRY